MKKAAAAAEAKVTEEKITDMELEKGMGMVDSTTLSSSSGDSKSEETKSDAKDATFRLIGSVGGVAVGGAKASKKRSPGEIRIQKGVPHHLIICF